MVAFFVTATVVTFKPGQCPVQDRQARLAQRVGGVGKAVALAIGKALAQLQLVGRQHIDDVMRARMEQRQAARVQTQAPQHQRGRQRDRIERAGGDAHKVAAQRLSLGGAGRMRGHHRHARGKARERLAEMRWLEVRAQGADVGRGMGMSR